MLARLTARSSASEFVVAVLFLRSDDGARWPSIFMLPDGREFGGLIEIAQDADSQMLAWGFDPESVLHG